ncbi:MAG: hypothetical protein QNJ20_02255, partial [Paracoccaceae bacterium]|nr:hypothetical protein [Paracoccaceae bacterium]
MAAWRLFNALLLFLRPDGSVMSLRFAYQAEFAQTAIGRASGDTDGVIALQRILLQRSALTVGPQGFVIFVAPKEIDLFHALLKRPFEQEVGVQIAKTVLRKRLIVTARIKEKASINAEIDTPAHGVAVEQDRGRLNKTSWDIKLGQFFQEIHEDAFAHTKAVLR